MKTDTPRTDEQHAQFQMGGFTLDFARQLERELTAVTEQRDRLAEAITSIASGAVSEARCIEIAREALQSLTNQNEL